MYRNICNSDPPSIFYPNILHEDEATILGKDFQNFDWKGRLGVMGNALSLCFRIFVIFQPTFRWLSIRTLKLKRFTVEIIAIRFSIRIQIPDVCSFLEGLFVIFLCNVATLLIAHQ